MRLIRVERWMRLRRMPLISPRLWLRRLVFWGGAIVVALFAMGFARAADFCSTLFVDITDGRPWLAFIITPAGLALAFLLTRHVFPGAQGSGIPQTVAALQLNDPEMIGRMVSLRIAVGKALLTLMGLACGASIGRWGPTVHIGACIMHAFGTILRLPSLELRRTLVLAGGAAGMAAAFNMPLAGIVFAIEELTHTFETRTSGTVFTAVVVAGATTLGLAGNFAYFGQTGVSLPHAPAVLAVILCSVVGGLAGGLFSRILIEMSNGLPGAIGNWIMRHPVVFAALCGLALAAIGLLSDGQTYGTGYTQAKGLLEETTTQPATYALMKLAATVISYISGIPGGIFGPSMSVGAGLGAMLAPLVDGAPFAAMVLLGMTAYFSGVIQAPITTSVIVLDMTTNHALAIPLMATAFLSFAISRLVCRRPLYASLARRFLEIHGRHVEARGVTDQEATDTQPDTAPR